MNIPKLAKGGIVNNQLPFIAKEKGKNLFKDKYYEIYKRTKNQRIKKKQLKKSWTLKMQNAMKPFIDEMNKVEEITLHIGDKVIVKKIGENNGK